MNLIYILQQTAAQALSQTFTVTIPAESLAVQPTNENHDGDLTIVLFPLIKLKLGTPEVIGTLIGDYLKTNLPEIVEKYSIIKGFLNLTLKSSYWIRSFNDALTKGTAFYRLHDGQNQTVMIEFPSPNTNKPLHLGHLRNIFLGDSLANILEAAGFKVIRACLYNDKGIHISKSMVAYKHLGAGQTPEVAGIKGDKFVGQFYVLFDKHYREQVAQLVAKGVEKTVAEKDAPWMIEATELYRQWEAGDKDTWQLWQTMNGWVYEGFEYTYDTLGVKFDKIYKESETYLLGKQRVEEGVNAGIFTRKADGSTWIDLTGQGLDEKILLRADGTSVYITQDIGTAELKFQDYGLDRSIYVIGNEQDYHMKVLIEILKKMNRPYAHGVYHLSYGMVDLPTGKMKSREGTVVDADDLITEMYETAAKITQDLGKTEGMDNAELDDLYKTLGIGALKYFILKVDPVKRMLFNPEESIDFKGHTGTFIQYTYARVRSVLRKAQTDGFTLTPTDVETAEPSELTLIKTLLNYPVVLSEAAKNYNPSAVAAFCYALAREYNRFYYEVPVLKAENQTTLQFRLNLCYLTAETLKNGLGLLGIKCPERM